MAEGEHTGKRFVEAVLPQQRLVDGKVFPLVLSPPSPSSITPHETLSLLKRSSPFLAQKLLEHGALFLRGFPIHTASDFHSVLEALGWRSLSYVGSAPRTHVLGAVYTANDASPDLDIGFHHEMALVTDGWPAKVLLFCETPPSEGGQTPILMSHKVTEEMWKRFPDLMEKLQEYGLLYIKVLPQETNSLHISQQGWPEAFGTKDIKEAEERATKLFNAKVEWLPEEKLKMIIGPYKAMRNFRKNRPDAWFNSMIVFQSGVNHDTDMSEHPYNVLCGDGSAIPFDVVEACRKIHEDNSVDIPWEKGDLMIVDNFLVMHGRRAYKPPRKVLVSLSE